MATIIEATAQATNGSLSSCGPMGAVAGTLPMTIARRISAAAASVEKTMPVKVPSLPPLPACMAAAKMPVNAIAHRFGGGGHENAAGCTLSGTLAEASAALLEAVRESLGAARP